MNTLYEIINPSDPYTFLASSDAVAAIPFLLLGSGQMAVRTADDESREVLPLMLFVNEDELKAWINKTIGGDGAKGVQCFIDANRDEIVAALRSVMIGSANARESAEDALSKIPEEDDRQAFLLARHDRERSSTNDIGAAAWAYADRLESEAVAGAVEKG